MYFDPTKCSSTNLSIKVYMQGVVVALDVEIRVLKVLEWSWMASRTTERWFWPPEHDDGSMVV